MLAKRVGFLESCVMKTTTPPLANSLNRLHVTLASLLILLACFAFSSQAGATCQEGCDTTDFNTFLGDDALVNNTSGFGNTAIGSNALINNTTGDVNTATGYNALFSNTTGFLNTATGAGALNNNTTGNSNTAMGDSALASNTIGIDNTATCSGALYNNTTGYSNTAIGEAALTFNTTGYLNTATGALALDQNTTGYSNTALGYSALLLNTTGSSNTAIGNSALYSNTDGSNNIAVGFEAGINHATGSNNIYIGSRGFPGEDRTIRIGEPKHARTFIAGITGVTVAGGVGVIVDSNGQLGTVVSSERFKDGIKPMDKASEAILALKPVTFRYKHNLDPADTPQFGLVAEDVEKVNPDLVARDDQRKPYTLRYDAVNAMLLNEFLKEHKKTEKLEATVASLIATVKEQAAEIQKVSAQLELSKSAPRTALNNQ